MQMEKKAPLVKTAGRVLDLLELIIKANNPLTFVEIKNALDIPKSSLYYLLQDLVNYEYFTYDPVTKQYSKGMRLVQYATVCVNNTNILREISLGLKEISMEFGEASHAGALEGRFVTYLSKIDGSNEISLTSGVGLRTPAHSTAMGKVLLSDLTEQEYFDKFKNVELEQITPHTITNLEELLLEIKKVSEQGYAFECQESILQGACISVPVYNNFTNKMIFAISITVPAYKVNEEYKQRLIKKMMEVSKKMSIKLGDI